MNDEIIKTIDESGNESSDSSVIEKQENKYDFTYIQMYTKSSSPYPIFI